MTGIATPNGETRRELNEEHIGVEERRCHIVIGGGSSGILLCNQLLENDDVILIERGSQNPHSTHVTSRTPYLWPAAAFAKGEATRSNSLPMCSLSNRTIMYPQGSGVGGTSNLNAMILSAGHPGVFNNDWHQKWSSEVMTRHFDVVESTVNPTAYHTIFLQKLAKKSGCDSLVESTGLSGNDNSVTKLIWDVNPFKSSYLTMISRATDERINLRDVLFQDHSYKEGKQIFAATKSVPQSLSHQTAGNLGGAIDRVTKKGKLTVLSYCNVVSIEFNDVLQGNGVAVRLQDELTETDTRAVQQVDSKGQVSNSSNAKLIAVGVKYLDLKSGIKTQKMIRPLGGGEIILCAGAFESPRILLSSGLGVRTKDTLPAVPVLPVTLRGIGRNLQDHTMLPILFVGNWWTAASQVSLLKDKMNSVSQGGEGPRTSDSKTRYGVSMGGILGVLIASLSCLCAVYLCSGDSTKHEIDGYLSPLLSDLHQYVPITLQEHTTALYYQAKNMPVLSTISLIACCLYALSWSYSMSRPPSGDNFPLNRVHGFLLVDSEGRVVSKDSTEAPSAQLLLVDGNIAPGYIMTELLLPRYSETASRMSRLYMKYLRPVLSSVFKMLFSSPLLAAAAACSYGIVVCNVQPHSRGRLLPATELSGSTEDLTAPLRIDLGFLSDEQDVRITMNAMATARKLLMNQPIKPSSPPLPGYLPSDPNAKAPVSPKSTPSVRFEALPGKVYGDLEKVANFRKYAEQTSTTYYHACGTCAMRTGRYAGTEKCSAEQKGFDCECNDCLAVVDEELKVLGVLNLRVGDASVFPRITSGPTSAACMAVGVGLGKLILGEDRRKCVN